jgi:hypothetical protein
LASVVDAIEIKLISGAPSSDTESLKDACGVDLMNKAFGDDTAYS